jgi:hypothetical protein
MAYVGIVNRLLEYVKLQHAQFLRFVCVCFFVTTFFSGHGGAHSDMGSLHTMGSPPISSAIKHSLVRDSPFAVQTTSWIQCAAAAQRNGWLWPPQQDQRTHDNLLTFLLVV